MDFVINQFAHQFQLPLQSPVLIFSLILFIILLAPILLSPLRVPSIVGLIMAGILIGPHGLNVLEQSLFVDVFSTIGLLYIMFLAGLDLNLIEFKANRNKSYVFGAFTFLIPLSLGFPVCYYLLDMDVYASFLVASIFATHTLVTYPTVSKYGITKDPSVAITVGGTILTDTAVLIALAVILGSHSGSLDSAFWLRLVVSIALFSVFLFVVVPRFARWFFQKMEDHRHAHYIFVLAVMFLAAFLADIASLEGIIGAFAAGLALNKFIPSSSALMNRIEFIGNSLFIPFFLISVGMIVDVRVLFSGFTSLMIALALTLVAFAGKYVAAHATQLVFRMSGSQRLMIFGLSSAHAAATLAVIKVGHNFGIVDDSILNAVVVIVLVSCVIASFVTEHAARQLGFDTDKNGRKTASTELEMEQILVPISSTTPVVNLLHLAILIKERQSIHPLAIVNVVPNTDEAEEQVALAKKAMSELSAEISGADVDLNVMATIDHNPAVGIARTAREIAADIIIMNWSQKTGVMRKIINNSVDSILYHTNKTLFMCNLQFPISNHTGVFVILPQFSEFETGFNLSIEKIARLSIELSLPITLNCNVNTYNAVQKFTKAQELTLDIKFREFTAWEDFFIVFRKLGEKDLIILMSARKGNISHNIYIDQLPEKLERHLNNFSKILIYP
ncbi:MAG: cation:proton antiporter [Ottowia sp.]|nr:cation:proton antiporter [Ottowia sp.]